ncbi:MAG: SPOR domain-containing protein [Treponema sp.]|jgi:DedD protein|nr:SPOR domain-containing protein [Treponema sp.]
MEKKKLLLIAVSLGIFLVIVIGLSILIFAPKKDNITAYPPTSSAYAGTVDPTSGTSGGSLPATLPDSSVYDGTPARSVGTGASGPSVTVEIAPPATASSAQAASSTSATSVQSLTPKVSSASTSSQSVATKAAPTPVTPTAIRPATTISGTTQSTSASAPTTTSSQSASRASTTTTSAATQNASATTTTRQIQPTSSVTSVSAKRTYESYWVQAGAFSTQIRAEDVKETLKTKGIAAVIETHNVQGKDFYRVRVGPYTSQNEADYWLALIKGIDGFEESQIWQNNVVR